MTKAHYTKVVLLSVALAFLVNIFFGRFVMAKISTWPLLNRLKILSPQAPIVINNRETVRVENNGDVVEAVNSIKSKISLVAFLANNGSVTVVGSAINLTSDGSFVTGASVFTKGQSNYFVILNDGRSAKISSQVTDPATSLTFFKADVNNIPVVNLAESRDLSVGDKILFVDNSLQNFVSKAAFAQVSVSQKDVAVQVFSADYSKNSFGVQNNSQLLSGQVVVNTNADVIGVWNGTGIVPSNLLKTAMVLYFANNQKISRPSFGFSYSFISKNEAAISGLTQGVLIKDVSGVPAKQAGLLIGDIITKIDQSSIDENSLMDDILQKYKPGDKVLLTVTRKNQSVNITLITGELK